MFYERLRTLCKLHGTNITEVAVKYLGVANSAPTGWKRGASPRSDVVLRAARHFHVSTDYLLGLSDAMTPVSPAQPGLSELVQLLDSCSEPARHAAVAAAKAIVAALDPATP